uniref:YceD family protein n=1 Tax=Ornithobacterium rhinotracheale TaxID=28251 RepID=UPI0039A453EF
MDKMKNYDVQFSGLKEGEHQFKFEIKQAFFDLFTFEQEFQKPDIEVKLDLIKKSTFLELQFTLSGEVELICDITNEPYTQPIDGEMKIVVKFGEAFDDSDDEVLILPHGEYKVNVAQLIFELTLLSIPIKHINPDANSEQMLQALDLLDQYAPEEVEDEIFEEEVDEEEIDPRWNKLKDLLE